MNEERFKTMMGVLGRTYMTERIFFAMDKDDDHNIDIGEYLDYFDVMINGTT
jgi:hypothetical protein